MSSLGIKAILDNSLDISTPSFLITNALRTLTPLMVLLFSGTDLYGQDILLARVLRDLQDLQVLRVQSVQQDIRVRQVMQVLRVRLDLQVLKELRDLRVQRELLVELLLNMHLVRTQQIVILVQEFLNLIMQISHQRQFFT